MSPMKMDRIEQALRTAIRFNDALNEHNVPEMMSLMSEDCVYENTWPAPDGARFEGQAAVTQFWLDFFAESPQAHLDIEEAFGFGERCVIRWKYNWVDADGVPGHVRGVDVFRVKDGLILEKLSYVKG